MEGREVNWLDIKWIRYEKTFGLIEFQTSLDDLNLPTQFDAIETRQSKPPRLLLTKCYDRPLPINFFLKD